MNCQFSTVDFSFAFLCECEFIEINFTQIKFQRTVLVGLKTQSIVFNDLQFNKDDPIVISKSRETFHLGESVKITDSLSFQKAIETN